MLVIVESMKMENKVDSPLTNQYFPLSFLSKTSFFLSQLLLSHPLLHFLQIVAASDGKVEVFVKEGAMVEAGAVLLKVN